MRLFGDREHHAGNAVDGGVTPLELRPLHDARHLLQEHRPLGVRGDGHLPELAHDAGRVGAEPAEHADRPLLLPRDGEATAGVDVARPECLLDGRQRNAVLEHGRRIDEDLILLAVASLHEHLGDARNLEQPRPGHPVGERPQAHRPLERGGEDHLVVAAGDREPGDPGRLARGVGTGRGGDPRRAAAGDLLPGPRPMAIPHLPQADGGRGLGIRGAFRLVGRARHGCERAAARPQLAKHAGDHDLAHDRGRGRHLRPDALGEHAGDGREPLLDGLTGRPDVDIPVELDVDHGEAGRGLAADGFHATGAQQGDFDRLRDERLHFLGRQSGALGDDHHPRPVEVGEHVDRERRRQIAPIHEQRQADDQHQEAGAE